MNRVLNGADRLEAAEPYLRGARLALLTNSSGVNKKGVPTYLTLAEKYDLRLLIAPEHGLKTNLQDGRWGAEGRDDETGALVFNLKSKENEGLDELLQGVDVAVYDIQDVGARFYTYLTNLNDMLRRCAKLNIPLIVLDRINPISGASVQGVLLDEEKYSSTIGEYSIVTRYGLTIGEYARYINAEKKIGCRVEVVGCEGWRRDMYADATDLLWVNPSPNIPSVTSAINYIGTCIFEATNVSEGRGTTRPFDLVGAPFVNGRKLCDEMNSLKLDGVVFRRAYFTPQFNKYAGEVCEGVELHVTDREAYDPILTAINLYRYMRRYPEFTCRENGLCLRFGSDFLLGDADAENYQAISTSDCRVFRQKTSKFLLY
jgi:uncharacterized protein YbbC (DUF1343 family)